ncbi:hypothetical protein GWK47_049230 [Chionoecetes opilio]|uniref:Uncharacterized protein n=1 Tax=Chionoecetes opilio TaxID=41210 RepID=A0A8J4YEX8_CHIOP|nr:hypothetical protein GWK47_049230 [Chionoecetes opilio]
MAKTHIQLPGAPNHEGRNLPEDCEGDEGAHQGRDRRERQQPRTWRQWRSMRRSAPTICRAVCTTQADQEDDLGRGHQEGAAGLEEEQGAKYRGQWVTLFHQVQNWDPKLSSPWSVIQHSWGHPEAKGRAS